MGQCGATWGGGSSGSPCWGWGGAGDPSYWSPGQGRGWGQAMLALRAPVHVSGPRAAPGASWAGSLGRAHWSRGRAGHTGCVVGGLALPEAVSPFGEQGSHGPGGRRGCWEGEDAPPNGCPSGGGAPRSCRARVGVSAPLPGRRHKRWGQEGGCPGAGWGLPGAPLALPRPAAALPRPAAALRDPARGTAGVEAASKSRVRGAGPAGVGPRREQPEPLTHSPPLCSCWPPRQGRPGPAGRGVQ